MVGLVDVEVLLLSIDGGSYDDGSLPLLCSGYNGVNLRLFRKFKRFLGKFPSPIYYIIILYIFDMDEWLQQKGKSDL